LLVTGEGGISESGEDLEADVTIANWYESRMPSDQIAALVEQGVDVIDLASEEMMAQEGTQLAAALATLDRSGLPYMGAGRDQLQARRPTILEVKDRRVAYFSYATAEGLQAGDDRLGLNFSDRDRVAEEIRAIRDQVDWVVVNLHWDGELSETPDSWQMDLAHSVIDAGADLVVGYHPQVLQGAEIYRDRPIVYALSHFILGEPTDRDFETAAIKVALKDDQMKIEVLPIQVRGFQPRIAEGESGRAILETFEDRSSVFDRPLPPMMVLSLQSDAEPVEASEDSNSIDLDAGFDDPSEDWQDEGTGLDTEWAPDLEPTEEESDPFIQDPFISDPQESPKSGQNQSKHRLFPRLWLPFEPKSVPESVPENRDSRQGHRSIDLPSFVRVHRTTPPFST
jgi:Bacterial capsule synthesis protein PGA_cap